MTLLKPAHPFYMIRHGQTDWNAEQRFQGRKDIAVNERGREQAVACARMLAEEGHDWGQWWFVASPLGRTRTTMEIIRRALGLDPAAYETDPQLLEVTFGAWEGRTLAELAETEPQMVKARKADKWGFVAPGGESYQIVSGRVRGFLQRLDRPAVIVTHGGVIRSARHLIEGIAGDAAAKGHVPQDDIYRFDRDRARWLRGASQIV